MWRVRSREELLHECWACCAELSSRWGDVLDVDEAGLGRPAGDVGAIESLEDRGSGLLGQERGGADGSGVAH